MIDTNTIRYDTIDIKHSIYLVICFHNFQTIIKNGFLSLCKDDDKQVDEWNSWKVCKSSQFSSHNRLFIVAISSKKIDFYQLSSHIEQITNLRNTIKLRAAKWKFQMGKTKLEQSRSVQWNTKNHLFQSNVIIST